MSNLDFARSQMAMSLAFHIVFAALGIGMPVLMAISEGLFLRTGKDVYLDLSKRWAKGTAILFAVGAVSGTVLSFELGLLWPGFMREAGAIIGMPFSLEGFAFFTEAIFLGVYMFGWNRMTPVLHWLSGVVVAVSGVLSGIFVVMANAWMNAPTGFRVENGVLVDIDPVAAMFNAASGHEVLHMTLAALVATGFAVASVHAYSLLRNRHSVFHRHALRITLAVGCVSIPLQILSGDISARAVAELQPEKLAAMEALYQTQAGAPLLMGGIPDNDAQSSRFGIRIPHGLSLLVAYDPNAVVTGLDSVPRADWPNVRVVHWSFDLMVLMGCALLALAAWVGGSSLTTRKIADRPLLLRAIVVAGPLGFLAIELGWMVTEVGRQPWVIYHVMRTADAVTPMPGIVVPFVMFTIVYMLLAAMVVILLRRLFRESMSPAKSHA